MRWIFPIFLAIAFFQVERAVLAASMSPQSVLPAWVEDEEALKRYVEAKYFGPPDSCDPIRDGEWLCHLSCSGACRLESFFDLKKHREVLLPQTEANYFLISKWKRIVSIAFVPSPRGWDLAFVSINIDTLMLQSLPLFSTDYQGILSFSLEPRGEHIGADLVYCLEKAGCFVDEIRLKRREMVLKRHRANDATTSPAGPGT